MYKVYDYYEGRQLLGTFDNWHDARACKKQWIEDTDGECDVEIEYIPTEDE